MGRRSDISGRRCGLVKNHVAESWAQVCGGSEVVGDTKGQNMVGNVAEMSWENCGGGSGDGVLNEREIWAENGRKICGKWWISCGGVQRMSKW